MLPVNNIHYSPVSGLIRCYRDGYSYAKRDDYILVISVNWLSDNTVFLFGAHGEMNRGQWLRILKTLYEKGAKYVQMQRANGRKMPYASVVGIGEHETLWSLDLDEIFGE